MKILVSACLLGVSCRYDGKSQPCEAVMELLKEHELIPVCPEQLGGLKTPRTAAERRGNQVVTAEGADVTEAYQKGAGEALRLAGLYGCRAAILKEKSPSCGYGLIYDGSFTGRKIPGSGVTAELFTKNGITVIGETKISNSEGLKEWIKEEKTGESQGNLSETIVRLCKNVL